MRSVAIIAAFAVPLAAPVAAGEPEVSVDKGNIVVRLDGKTTRLTASGHDDDPIVAPNGKAVYFTRSAAAPGEDAPDGSSCHRERPDTLMRIGIDGTGETKVLGTVESQEPKQALCGFSQKQFTSDGKLLYFLSPAWATSAALHVLEVKTGHARFVTDANDFSVLTRCAAEPYHDALVVQQHRYLKFSGSYDWYWFLDPDTGKIDPQPVGEFDTPADAGRFVRESGLCDT